MTNLQTFILCQCGFVIKTEEEKASHVCPITVAREAADKEKVDPELLERTKNKRCPHCGAKMEKKKHVLSKGIVRALRVTIAGVKAQDKNDIVFGDIPWESFNQRQNFQKLRYFGLVAHPKDANGNSIIGRWLITRRGGNFLRCEQAIPSFVVTYRNHVLERSESLVTIQDVEQDQAAEYYQREFAYEKDMPDYDDSDSEEDEDL